MKKYIIFACMYAINILSSSPALDRSAATAALDRPASSFLTMIEFPPVVENYSGIRRTTKIKLELEPSLLTMKISKDSYNTIKNLPEDTPVPRSLTDATFQDCQIIENNLNSLLRNIEGDYLKAVISGLLSELQKTKLKFPPISLARQETSDNGTITYIFSNGYSLEYQPLSNSYTVSTDHRKKYIDILFIKNKYFDELLARGTPEVKQLIERIILQAEEREKRTSIQSYEAFERQELEKLFKTIKPTPKKPAASA